MTASDLNSEFSNILNNPASLISPMSGGLDMDGFTITLDAAAATSVVSTTAASWSFTSGAKTGTPATTGSVANWGAQTFTDSATAGAGTAASYAAYAIQRPTLAATNATVTTTNAATLYVANAPAAGANETLTNAYALWVAAGASLLGGALSVSGDLTVGGASIPQVSKSTAYTTVLTDANKHILHPTADNNARTFTIDSNANVAYVIGTTLTFVNQINTVTIAITSDTLTFAGDGTTGSRTLAANGIATALKVTSTSWLISGTGLT